MAIVDDYPAIAAELRRIQAEKRPQSPENSTDEQWKLAISHRMWASEAGERLYRRLERDVFTSVHSLSWQNSWRIPGG
jgi:hypothetical protein